MYIGELDLSKTAVMRETERLGDMHSYLTSRLTAILSDIDNKSMYSAALEAGETVVFKIMTSKLLRNVLFGIANYYNVLDDKETATDGADYTLKLPNGMRLDVVGVNFESYENFMMIVPVRSSDAEHVTSVGKILDRGTYTAQYTPVSNGAANKRIVTNSREIVFVTNPVAALISVKGFEEELQLLIGNGS